MIIILIISMLAGFGSGGIQYGIAMITCGRQPVAATNFAAAYTYDLPGDPLYSVSPFDTYYCTEQAAISAGYQHSPLSPGGQAAAKAELQHEQEQAKFSPDKIPFTAYLPTQNGYSAGDIRVQAMPGNQNQVFFAIKQNGSNVVGVREGLVGNEYQLCVDKKYACVTTGADAQGHIISRQTVPSHPAPIVSYAISIGTTFITLEGVPSDFTDATAATIFNSLTAYK